MKHQIINEVGGDEDAFKAGYLLSIAQAVQSGSDKILLITPQKKQLDEGIIESVLGRPAILKLKKGETIGAGVEGVTLSAKVGKDVRVSSEVVILLLAYMSADEAKNVVNSYRDSEGSVFVAWMNHERDDWIFLPDII